MAKVMTLQAAAGEVVSSEVVELPASVLELSRGCKKNISKHDEGETELEYEAGCEKKRRRKMTKHKLSAIQLQKIAKLVLDEGVS